MFDLKYNSLRHDGEHAESTNGLGLFTVSHAPWHQDDETSAGTVLHAEAGSNLSYSVNF